MCYTLVTLLQFMIETMYVVKVYEPFGLGRLATDLSQRNKHTSLPHIVVENKSLLPFFEICLPYITCKQQLYTIESV